MLGALRETRFCCACCHGRNAELGRYDGAGRPATNNVALAGKHSVSGVDRSASSCEFFGELPRRGQAITGLELANCDRGSKVIVDLPVKRDVVAARENDFTLFGQMGHGLVRLREFGPIG